MLVWVLHVISVQVRHQFVARAVDADQTGAQGDVGLDFPLGLFHVVGHSGYFEDGLFFSRRSHDVGGRLLLDALDGGAFGTDDQAHYSVGYSHLYQRWAGNSAF